jgi:hypothetical protein
MSEEVAVARTREESKDYPAQPRHAQPKNWDELTARAADAAVRVSKGDHSNYNGQDPKNVRRVQGLKIAGEATWEQGLRLNYGYVEHWLRHMYAHQGQVHDRETRLHIRRALETLFHEHLHLISSAGTNHTQAEGEMKYAEVQALEEGVTEAYAYEHLDDFITDLGIDEVCPGIMDPDVKDTPTYPQFTPAAIEMTRLAGAATGRGGPEMLRRLAVENPQYKWRVLTGEIVNASKLYDVLPKEQAGPANLRVAQAMWKDYAKLVALGNLPEDQQQVRSKEIAAQAFGSGQTEIATIRQEVQTHGRMLTEEERAQLPADALNASRLANTGTPPPQATAPSATPAEKPRSTPDSSKAATIARD